KVADPLNQWRLAIASTAVSRLGANPCLPVLQRVRRSQRRRVGSRQAVVRAESLAMHKPGNQILRELRSRSIAVSRILGHAALHYGVERSNLRRVSRQVIFTPQ